MTLRVAFRRAAKIEFEDAAVGYGENGRGLGDGLIREIEQAIANAAAAPQRHPVVFGDIRRTVTLPNPIQVGAGQRSHRSLPGTRGATP